MLNSLPQNKIKERPNLEFIELLEKQFVNVQEFPIPRFNFPDITPLLENNPSLFRQIIDSFVERHRENPPDKIVCIESFGYVFGVPIAYSLGKNIVLARRGGKLPRPTNSCEYNMVYGSRKKMEIHKDAIVPGESILVVDDFLASGGTSQAVSSVISSLGGKIIGYDFVVEIPMFRGRKHIEKYSNNIKSMIFLNFDINKSNWSVINHNF